MFSCPLCDDWLYVRSLCDKCKKTKNIVRCYGIDQVNVMLEDIFLREDDKITNKAKAQRQKVKKETSIEKVAF